MPDQFISTPEAYCKYDSTRTLREFEVKGRKIQETKYSITLWFRYDDPVAKEFKDEILDFQASCFPGVADKDLNALVKAGDDEHWSIKLGSQYPCEGDKLVNWDGDPVAASDSLVGCIVQCKGKMQNYEGKFGDGVTVYLNGVQQLSATQHRGGFEKAEQRDAPKQLTDDKDDAAPADAKVQAELMPQSTPDFDDAVPF